MSGTNTTTPTTTDPEADQAAALSFPDAYAASGLPTAFYPAAYAQFQQESTGGQADPANPMRVTATTAANPGYGLPAMDPKDLWNPGKGQANLAYGLQYEAHLAKAKGIDPTTPDGAAALLSVYNGGGDPDYVKHVAGRMDPTAGTQMAANGPPPGTATDAPAPGMSGVSSQPATQAPAQQPVSYTPPPLPKTLMDRISDNTGLWKTQRQRELLAMAGGFLSGSGAGAGNFGSGLGRALNAAGQVQDDDNKLAMQAYQAQSQQALAAMQAQRYGGQLLLGGGQLQVKQGQLDEKVRNDRANNQLGQGKLDNQGRSLDLKGQQITQQGLIGAQNAITNRDRVANQAANLGAPAVAPIAPGSLPGVGASGLQSAPLPAAASAPQQAPQGPAPAPAQAPQEAPQQPAQGPQPSPSPTPTGQSGQAPQAPSTPPAGIGASGLSTGFPMAGSIYDGLQGGLMARRQTQAKVQAENHKENEGDTAALETINAADTLAASQKALVAKVQQENPGLTGTGLLATVQQYIAKQTNDPLVQEINKNQAQLTASNYPHGGALRNAQLKTAADQAAGLAQAPVASDHLLDQQMASRALTREVLQARQNFIAQHPQEDPTVSFDPVANNYLAQHSAYVEGPDGVVAAKPGLADFTRAHTNPQTGRFDPEVQAAGLAAFGGQQSSSTGADQTAQAAGAQAFPAQRPSAAPTATLPNLAPNQRAWLTNRIHNEPGFAQKFSAQYGQAALTSLSQ